MGFFSSSHLKKMLVFIGCFFMISSLVFSQAKEESDFGTSSSTKRKKGFQLDPDRIVIGGGFGAQFGSVTLVELSPTVGYLITDNWLAGVGGRYIYFEEDLGFFTYKTNIYGGNIFNQYYFLESFVAHAEYELLNLEDINRQEERINISSVFVGGGYRSTIGGNAFATILVLFNLNDDINSPYTNPILRVNFGFGL